MYSQKLPNKTVKKVEWRILIQDKVRNCSTDTAVHIFVTLGLFHPQRWPFFNLDQTHLVAYTYNQILNIKLEDQKTTIWNAFVTVMLVILKGRKSILMIPFVVEVWFAMIINCCSPCLIPGTMSNSVLYESSNFYQPWQCGWYCLKSLCVFACHHSKRVSGDTFCCRNYPRGRF